MREAIFAPLLLAIIFCAYGLLIVEAAAYIESQNRYFVSNLSHDLPTW